MKNDIEGIAFVTLLHNDRILHQYLAFAVLYNIVHNIFVHIYKVFVMLWTLTNNRNSYHSVSTCGLFVVYIMHALPK